MQFELATHYCLPQKLKSTFLKFFKMDRRCQSEKKIEKTLILAFVEVIVQPPKRTFDSAFFSNFKVLCNIIGMHIAFAYAWTCSSARALCAKIRKKCNSGVGGTFCLKIL